MIIVELKALFTQCFHCFGPNLSLSAKHKDKACGAPAKARFLSSCKRPLLPWLGFCSEVFWLENVSNHWPKYVLAKLFLVILGWRGRLGVRFWQHMWGDIFSVSSISCGNNVISQHCQIANFPKNNSLKIFFSICHFSQQQHNSLNHHLGVSRPCCDLSGLHWCKTSSDKG